MSDSIESVGSAFGDIADSEDAADIELSENTAEDFIEYFRGNVVGHEEEGLLMWYSALTGWAADTGVHNNVIGKGAPGSGKSLTKNTVENVLPDRDTYVKTDVSPNALLDSKEWDLALVAPLDEYDKVRSGQGNIIEVLKSSNPEDGGYSKDRNVEDEDAKGGYSPTEVKADAIPWILLYAPSSKKGGINDELEDRALILYFSNSKHTRRAIGRKEFGHEDIDLGGEDDSEYIYDTHELAAALRQHIRELPIQTQYEEIETDDGVDERLVGRTGGTYVYFPKWIWYAVEPIFNVDEDFTNRVYGLVSNLIIGSAIDNHDSRPTTEIEIYEDPDSPETTTEQATVVQRQDVANVLSCLPALLSTTHQLTPLKRHLLDAVEATEPMTDADGTTVTKVQDWLADNDIPHPSRSTLKSRLDELAEDYYLQQFKSTAGPKGNADAYQIHSEGALQPPRVKNLDVAAEGDDVDLGDEPEGVDVDLTDPFADCTDPIREQPFSETISQYREQFAQTDHSGSEDDLMMEAMGGSPDGDVTPITDTDDGDSDSDGGQASLTEMSDHADGSENAESADTSDSEDTPTLDPDGSIETPTQAYLLGTLAERADGETWGPQHDVSHFLGIVGEDEHSANVDVSGTVMDPDHEVWADRPDLRDDRVISESDCLRELSDAYAELKQRNWIMEDDSSGPPAMFVLRVASGSS